MHIRLSIFLLFLTLFPAIVQARIIHVPADSTTIQGGINGTVDGDTVMIAPGTYHEHDIDFFGKAITVTGTNPEDSAVVASTIVDGDSAGSVFTFHSGEDARSVLTGMTITGGFDDTGGGIYCYWYSSPTISRNIISRNSANLSGGGIFCWYSSPAISNNIIVENTAGDKGGGIFCRSSSDPEILENTISGNTAGDSGGGIYCTDSSPSISDNTVAQNTAFVYGGGIACYDDAPASITGNVIIGNQVSGGEMGRGGGICSWDASPTIRENTIRENSADFGGGIWCYRMDSEISENVILGNTADFSGAGIEFNYASPIMKNNLVAGNSASNYGGGIHCHYWSSPSISNNTVTRNSAVNGGGISFIWNSSPVVKNTIFWDNNASTGREIYVGDEIYPSNPAISYSLVGEGLASVFIDTSCSIEWGSGMIHSDPRLRDPSNDDYHLSAIMCGDSLDSPGIDAGDPLVEDYLLDCDHGLGTSRSDMGTYGGRWDEPPVSIGDDAGGPRTSPIPRAFRLSQNYPNPFNPSTTIAFDIPDIAGTGIPDVAGAGIPVSEGGRQRVTLTIYDIRGRRVRTLVDSDLEPGSHRVVWRGRNDEGLVVSSGVYLYSLRWGEQSVTRKMIVHK